MKPELVEATRYVVRASDTAPEGADAQKILAVAHGACREGSDPATLWAEIDAFGGGVGE